MEGLMRVIRQYSWQDYYAVSTELHGRILSIFPYYRRSVFSLENERSQKRVEFTLSNKQQNDELLVTRQVRKSLGCSSIHLTHLIHVSLLPSPLWHPRPLEQGPD